jgi:hypothetical protein
MVGMLMRLRRQLPAGSLLAALGLSCLSGCGNNPEPTVAAPEVSPALAREAISLPNVQFKDITEAAGIHFQHINGAFGKKLLPETMGSGVAFLDYDGDGSQDLLLVNSCYWPGYEAPGQPTPTLALYRNRGDGTFEDVTTKAGLAITMYGMGVTVGDYDNDGWPDVFVTGLGGNRLFHNVADGSGGRRFEDVTISSGVGGPGGWANSASGDFLKRQEPLVFSTSAAFLDYDGDGLLDLFVCNYVSWSPDFDLSQPFQLKGRGRAYGPPTNFDGAQCFLYRNLGGGRFEDMSARAGIQVMGSLGRAVGKSLGVLVSDIDEDGWPDIIVANDTVRNFFFHNKGDGTFEEIGERSYVAYAQGQARGAMGLDRGYYRPGRSGICIGNFAKEPNTFLLLDDPKRLLFSDGAMAEGIAGPSRLLLKFGVFFFDYDLDGRLDLLTCNGHLEPEIHEVEEGQFYKQAVQLFWNTGTRRSFEPVTDKQAGKDLFQPLVGRGCAFADINSDGYPDVVLMENGGRTRLLRNEGGTGHHWVRLVLQGDGQRSNRSAIGARVILEADGKIQHREIVSSRGYLSQSELPVTFGLGTCKQIDKITIRWPGKNGDEQVLKNLEIDCTHVICQEAK